MNTLLFQGDSITDASRKRDLPDHLGGGYVNMAAGALNFRYPQKSLRILNRGVSGDRTKNLLGRWQADCLDLNPTWLSIYVGINNTWRKFDQDDPTPPEVFEAELSSLIAQAIGGGVQAGNIVLLEPFLLDEPAGTKSEWFEDLEPKQNIVRKLSEVHGTRWIPLQALFNDALERAPAAWWAPDGVHPTPAGHYLIAQAWLRTMEDLIGGGVHG